ncbi:haloacid dehalogenase [Thalassobaculum fulvum]|uniref:Haloacid dehalogenase n=1 Tax=Thalassobaculum fulvum TaxID=1633335 RepID=A0A918XVW3_9PROT|nr:HAD-IA family hydrolase [Thalassobaculum fulvum]GHD58939.1 haloacid dehalogenase [Thalassobaculum fulvum]
MSDLRLCALDLDGTLIDSQHHIVAAMSSAFRAEGLPPASAAKVREVVGLPLDQAIRQLAPQVRGLQLERVGQAYRDAYFDAKEADSAAEPLMPGARAALDALEEAGWLLAVVTGKGRRGLHDVLDAHGLLARFVVLKSADDGPGKPDPTLLLDAVREAGSSPGRAVMVGDTVFDMGMARRARVAGIAVTWGYHDLALLETERPAAVIDRFEDLLGAADRLVPV